VCTDLVPSPVDKTQSRRQSGLVCSLLVVSLLLSAVVGGEGELSESTVRTLMYGTALVACVHMLLQVAMYSTTACMLPLCVCVQHTKYSCTTHSTGSLSSFLYMLNALVAFALYTYIINRTQLFYNYIVCTCSSVY